jgi:hypothetical protein
MSVPAFPVSWLSIAIVNCPEDGFGYNQAKALSGKIGQALNALPGEPPSQP